MQKQSSPQPELWPLKLAGWGATCDLHTRARLPNTGVPCPPRAWHFSWHSLLCLVLFSLLGPVQ